MTTLKHLALLLLLTTFTLVTYNCGVSRKAYVEPTTGRMVQVQTSYGNIDILLSDSTPLHRNNFIQLVKNKTLDSLLFHRVINTFMIQGGDPTSKYATNGVILGNGGLQYTIPAEIKSYLFHKKGALAAARDNNPTKASSSTQFYIVQGKRYTSAGLDSVEKGRLQGVKLADSVRLYYQNVGGTPQLDRNYTVFGQVINGLQYVDSIAAQKVDKNNRPLQNQRFRVVLLH